MSPRRDIRPREIADPYAQRDRGDENTVAIPQADGDSTVLTEFNYCNWCCAAPMRPDSIFCSVSCETAARLDGQS